MIFLSAPVPPPTNRGAQISEPMRVAVDWLEFSLWNVSVEQVKRMLRGYQSGDFHDLEQGALGYERSSVGPGGSRILWSGRRPEVHVRLPGKWCAGLDETAMRTLLSYVHIHGRPTRVDLAADDWSRSVVPEEVREAFRRGEAVTHIKKRQLIENCSDGESGCTFYLGGGTSRQKLRVYDKGAQSRGEIDAIRWEVEARKEAAVSLLDSLLLGEWGEVWASRVVQLVDFRMRNADSDVSRCPRLPWFTALVGAAKKAKVYGAKPIVSLERAATWIRKQVAPTLAAVFAAHGGDLDYLTEVLGNGRARWRETHRLVVAQGLAA